MGRRIAHGRSGPLWTNAYAFGTGSAARSLRRDGSYYGDMDELGMMLDVSHLTDESLTRHSTASRDRCWLATPIAALVPGDRQLDDAMIRRMIERDGVIGAVMDAWMLQPSWVRGETTNENLTLDAVADQIDHVCNSPATAATRPSAPTSTAATASSKPQTTSTPSPTSRPVAPRAGLWQLEHRGGDAWKLAAAVEAGRHQLKGAIEYRSSG